MRLWASRVDCYSAAHEYPHNCVLPSFSRMSGGGDGGSNGGGGGGGDSGSNGDGGGGDE